MGLVLLTWTAVIAFTWWSASSEIHRVFDAQLAQVAEMLALTTLHETEEQDLEDFVKKLDHQDYFSNSVYGRETPAARAGCAAGPFFRGNRRGLFKPVVRWPGMACLHALCQGYQLSGTGCKRTGDPP
jgi:hypothetical protein